MHPNDPNKRLLVIIDGNAIMHRAFHALPPLTTKDGKLTNAVYGFCTMLFNIRKQLSPSYLIVCFDRPEPTFRKQMYAGYQAKRPKMDEGLVGQWGLVQQVVTAMKIPIYELAGYEADDIIGSLAFQAMTDKLKNSFDSAQDKKNEKLKIEQVTIVTGDRDILQLVNHKTNVYMPIQGLTNAKLYGEKEVVEKFGVTPAQIIDLKALMGDASDNYPGVRGIGPKTARELLQVFGTVETLYKAIQDKDERLRKFSDKILQALSVGAEDAVLAKKLATIDVKTPVTLDLSKAVLDTIATDEVKELFMELGFWSLLKRLDASQEIKRANDQKSNKKNKGIELEIQENQMSLL
jgi:DNA polymerase-1